MHRVSPFSATQIGAVENVGNRQQIREQFKAEAKVVNEELKRIHHCRKIAHMQTNYPNTITTLSQTKIEQPQVQQKASSDSLSSNKTMKQNEFYTSMNANIHGEHNINFRKRAFNREVGRKATLDGIMKGTAPVGKNILYPEKATHVQCLHLSGSISMPNPHIVPPEVPRGKKWLGDDFGWSS